VKLTDDDLMLNLSIPPHQASKLRALRRPPSSLVATQRVLPLPAAVCALLCPPFSVGDASHRQPPAQCKLRVMPGHGLPTLPLQAREIRQELLRRGVPAPPLPQI